jgi:hypothetical protein
VANEKESPANAFKRVLTAAMKTIAEDPELTVAFGNESASLSGNKAKLPQIGNELKAAEIAIVRGLSDSYALRIANHNDKVHNHYQPQGKNARAVFELRPWRERLRWDAFALRAELRAARPGGPWAPWEDSDTADVRADLSADLSAVEETFALGGACAGECSHALIGFEGLQLVARGGAYFMCASAYGNASAHGGPSWPAIAAEGAGSTIFYSTFCGRADSLRGPFLDPSGDAGGWLSVPKGGHNTYFADGSGALYSTLWYGSSARDMPPADAPLVDLPSLVSVDVVGGRLVALGAPPAA